ncbi:MAG TPA: glycosyltransferase, partial [Synergistales bacterium]|nr:glycosyltransferase [Synergistales bacterium]
MNTTDTAAVPSWRRSGSRRRIALLFLVLIPTITSSYTMARLLPERASLVLDALLVAVFGILFAWISVGFWAFMGGLFVLLTKRDRYRVSKSCDGRDLSIPDANARTAILIPIYNEEVNRVFAGVRTVYRSLKQTGALDRFDIFLLSDSTSPDVWVEEEEAWHDFRREEEGTEAHVFYRKRDNNIKRKSGNVADFCRRWGKNYRYMIVFDADSVMTGESMVRLVQIMEDRSDIGIIQTLPLAVNRETLIARVQQFANHVQGPLLAAGLHFWQLGDAQYCGH